MRPIGAIARTRAAATGPLGRGKSSPTCAERAGSESSRALIAVAPPAESEPAPPLSRRPAAGFIAHLIATAQQAPQTRERRRADPDVAVSTYRAAMAGAPAGRRLDHSC